MLRSSRISAFPVVDDIGRVIVVVSEADLLVKEAALADGTSVLAALRHWREDARSVVKAVRHVQGVVAVRDRLSYPGDVT